MLDSKWPAQLQEFVRVLKFEILDKETCCFNYIYVAKKRKTLASLCGCFYYESCFVVDDDALGFYVLSTLSCHFERSKLS